MTYLHAQRSIAILVTSKLRSMLMIMIVFIHKIRTYTRMCHKTTFIHSSRHTGVFSQSTLDWFCLNILRCLLAHYFEVFVGSILSILFGGGGLGEYIEHRCFILVSNSHFALRNSYKQLSHISCLSLEVTITMKNKWNPFYN